MSNNDKLTPKLRFPEFRKGPGWEKRSISSILSKVANPVTVDLNQMYREIGIRSHGKGIFHKVPISGNTIADKRVFWVVQDAFVVNIVFAWEQAVATTSQAEVGMIASHRFPMYVSNQESCDVRFIARIFQSKKGKYLLGLASPGGAGRNRTLGQKEFEKLEIIVPKKVEEQRKIADCLSSMDELIAAEGRKLESLRAYKKGLMQQLFPRDGETTPRLRFPEFRNVGKWEDAKLDDLAKRRTGHTPNKANPAYYNGGIKWVSLADSKRLDKGLISQTEIEISHEGIQNSSAVLHPAGSVILSRDAGVGKSAVTAIPMAVSQHFIVWICDSGKLSNWFLYFVLQKLKPLFERIATGSTIKTIGMPFFTAMRIILPPPPEQQRIAACLSSLDEQIATQSLKIEGLKQHKNGLMQQLFPSAEEVE